MVRTTIFVSLACSLLAFCGGVSLRRPCAWHHGHSLVPVVVAAVDVPAGTPLTFDMISQRSVPEQFVDSRMVKPDSASYVIGQPVKEALQAGDVLRWSDFPSSLARKLSQGTVAIAIDVQREVYEGDHLDLLLSDGTALVTNARVLSTGAVPWLEVTPAEARAAAQRKPEGVTLVLRGR